jgi:hypothetical protein
VVSSNQNNVGSKLVGFRWHDGFELSVNVIRVPNRVDDKITSQQLIGLVGRISKEQIQEKMSTRGRSKRSRPKQGMIEVNRKQTELRLTDVATI